MNIADQALNFVDELIRWADNQSLLYSTKAKSLPLKMKKKFLNFVSQAKGLTGEADVRIGLAIADLIRLIQDADELDFLYFDDPRLVKNWNFQFDYRPSPPTGAEEQFIREGDYEARTPRPGTARLLALLDARDELCRYIDKVVA